MDVRCEYGEKCTEYLKRNFAQTNPEELKKSRMYQCSHRKRHLKQKNCNPHDCYIAFIFNRFDNYECICTRFTKTDEILEKL